MAKRHQRKVRHEGMSGEGRGGGSAEPQSFAVYLLTPAIRLASTATSTESALSAGRDSEKMEARAYTPKPVEASREGGAEGRPSGIKEALFKSVRTLVATLRTVVSRLFEACGVTWTDESRETTLRRARGCLNTRYFCRPQLPGLTTLKPLPPDVEHQGTCGRLSIPSTGNRR